MIMIVIAFPGPWGARGCRAGVRVIMIPDSGSDRDAENIITITVTLAHLQ